MRTTSCLPTFCSTGGAPCGMAGCTCTGILGNCACPTPMCGM
jgi:hypothetical protein